MGAIGGSAAWDAIKSGARKAKKKYKAPYEGSRPDRRPRSGWRRGGSHLTPVDLTLDFQYAHELAFHGIRVPDEQLEGGVSHEISARGHRLPMETLTVVAAFGGLLLGLLKRMAAPSPMIE